MNWFQHPLFLALVPFFIFLALPLKHSESINEFQLPKCQYMNIYLVISDSK